MLSSRNDAQRQLPRTRVHITDVTQTSFHMQWLRVRGADTYDIKTTPEAHVTRDNNALTAYVDELTPSSTYTIHVRARAGDLHSPWTAASVRTLEHQLQDYVQDDVDLTPVSECSMSACTLQVCDKCHFYGCLDETSPAVHRFATFRAGRVSSAHGTIIDIQGARGVWQTEAWGKLVNTYLHVKVDDGKWLDANELHMPSVERRRGDGYACALRTSDPRRRRITFGGLLATGTIYVRIGLPCDGRRLAGIKLVT